MRCVILSCPGALGAVMKNLKKVTLGLIVGALSLAGCNNGGKTAATTTSTTTSTAADCVNCSPITPENFVAALVALGQAGTIDPSYANSTLVKGVTDIPGSNTFVIWNGDSKSYQAINILSTYSAFCTSAGECSNINPDGAAEALADAKSSPHEQNEPITITSTTGSPVANGTITIQNGTETWGYIGTGNAESVVIYPLQNLNQNDNQGNPTFQDPYNDGLTYSENIPTRDTDLQQVQLAAVSEFQKAAQLSGGLQMNFQSAIQLTELADTIQKLQAGQSSLTSDDRAAVLGRLQGIAGITSDELATAVQEGLKGNMTSSNALIDKVSLNLGMPADALRNRILPQLGVEVGQ
jgi:hypothetical protein